MLCINFARLPAEASAKEGHEILTATGLMYLYALVSGNFLHISTTIVVESSPEHHFNARKMAVVILGALLAIGAEFLM